MPRVLAVVLTALEVEAEAFREELGKVERVTSERRTYFRASVGDREVIIRSFGTMGNVASAVAARDAVARWNPEFIVLAGIAGGAKAKGRRLGDVFVPTQVVYPELGKVTEPQGVAGLFIPRALRADVLERRWEVYRPAAEFLDAARAASQSDLWAGWGVPRPDGAVDPPAVVEGTVASGEKVIGSADWMSRFATVWPKAIGVEMEGIGVALATYEADEAPNFGLIKAVSDWADRSKNDDWRWYAARASARVAARTLTILAKRKSGERPQPQVAGSVLSTHASPLMRTGWGKRKVCLCRRLENLEAHELADLIEIPQHEVNRFTEGGVCRGIWEWLERRGKLSELAQFLKELGREDLAEALESDDLNELCEGVLVTR